MYAYFWIMKFLNNSRKRLRVKNPLRNLNLAIKTFTETVMHIILKIFKLNNKVNSFIIINKLDISYNLGISREKRQKLE